MTLLTMIFRSLVHYRRVHIGTVLGASLATAVLVGALVVGDSVRQSLGDLNQARLGKGQTILASGERLFPASLAERVSAASDLPCAPALHLRGLAVSEGGAERVPRVNVLGVEKSFWKFSLRPGTPPNLAVGTAAVNRRLAARLGLRKGSTLLLRIPGGSPFPGEAPLAEGGGQSRARRLRVSAVVEDAELGNFALAPSQVPPHNLFVSLPWLSDWIERPGRANLLLCPAGRQDLNGLLPEIWTLEDGQASLRPLEGRRGFELLSDRVFLDGPLIEAGLQAHPAGQGVFTYFVNRLSTGPRSTPYSFVSAPGPPLVPPDTDDDEIILNRWIAEDLEAVPGDRVEVTFFILGGYRRLLERTEAFRVKAVIPLTGRAGDRTLMPAFPGLSGVDDCSDWDPGAPIDLDRIRDKDEAYWDAHRGTPKAFITLPAARRLWGSRFGSLTAIRYEGAGILRKDLEGRILRNLAPSSRGLIFRDLGSEGVKAGKESVDFGSLFLGLSFFIIVSALLLTGLLFGFSVEARREETALLLSLGFPVSRIRRLRLGEGGALILLSCPVGAGAGVLYVFGVLEALGSVWQGAVGTSALAPSLELPTLLLGTAVSAATAFAVVGFVVVRQTRRQVRSPTGGLSGSDARVEPGWSVPNFVVSGLAALGTAAILFLGGSGPGAAGAFFGAGALALFSGLALCNGVLHRFSFQGADPFPSLRILGFRLAARRRGRSLAVIAMLSVGVFLVTAVGANRKDLSLSEDQRAGGTGGFAFFGLTTLSVSQDLGTREGQKALGIEHTAGLSILPVRLRESADASCLNLNRVARPSLLGVNSRALAERGAFTFISQGAEETAPPSWELLQKTWSDGSVSGVADQTVITWGLGAKIGDTIEYRDDQGRPFSVRLVGGLANSIFQGHVLISEQSFLKKFPFQSGARVFLVDAPLPVREKVRRGLLRSLEDRGLDLEPAVDRLAAFQTVENTYLDIFLLLGGLGLWLGSAGLGIVTVRNILERRAELALMGALGFSPSSLRRLLYWEQGFLLFSGLATGATAAGVAVGPALLASGTGFPWGTLFIVLVALPFLGWVWIALAARIGLWGDLLTALRSE